VTVWLALDPSLEENGCMRVIPRALHGYSEYEECDAAKNVFAIEIKKGQFDEGKAVSAVLQPNQCSLHDARIIHGSRANTSNIRRCGYTMRYISTRTKWNSRPWHQIYLARGRDHAGNEYADPTKAYPQLARFREQNGKKGH
jgi:ectoine hydroxylase-related dioxygenase (phytanoyl-CoA dioxygenase family)